MIGSGIIRGTEKALQYYQEEGTPIFALYEGAAKDPVCHNLKGKFDDIEDSIELIKKYFNYITPDPKTKYVIKFWDERPQFDAKGKLTSTPDGSLRFVTNNDEEVTEYIAGYQQRVGSYNNEILSRLAAIESKMNEPEEEEEEEVQKPDLISGIVSNPEIQNMIVGYIGMIVDRLIPLKKTVAINGVNDENRLAVALEILQKHDPELESDLFLLASMAENDPGQFQFLLKMLRK
jgi:hypothetical protein